MRKSDSAGALLTIDLDAIASNWRLLSERLKPGARAGAVVKANAYGLGVGAVAPALYDTGCQDFFVATLEEGAELRRILPQAEIAVLVGPTRGNAQEFVRQGLTPVLHELGQLETWSKLDGAGLARHAMLQIDTGMSRLGLPPEEVSQLTAQPERLANISLACVVSHLACAEDHSNAKNVEQLRRFQAAKKQLEPVTGPCPASLANSSGIFLGKEYHFDLVRPGAALYGVNPTPSEPNPMAEVIRLQAKIIQVRRVDRPETVGYGATHAVTAPSRIATVPVGYADGYLRSSSNRASGFIGGVRVPVVGRVSMDMITLDVSGLPEDDVKPGTTVDLIGGEYTVDALARDAGTIGYEILTSLGHRYHRQYRSRGATSGRSK